MMENRLKEWRNKRGYTQQQFADLVGKTRNTILTIENGKIAFTDKNKQKFAEVLNCSVNDLVTFDNVESTGHVSVQVKGYVQAGLFGGAEELTLEGQEIISANPKHTNAHCLIVKGDSMNNRYNDGTKLICVPFFGTPEEIEPGRAVIVEAICMADEKEITVKEFYTDDQGEHWLLPKSTNPTYQNYPVPNGEDLDIVINGRKIKEINIKAIVVSSQYHEE